MAEVAQKRGWQLVRPGVYRTPEGILDLCPDYAARVVEFNSAEYTSEPEFPDTQVASTIMTTLTQKITPQMPTFTAALSAYAEVR